VGFLETIESARAFLERNGRVSLRALQREFGLDDEAREELVEELVDVQQVAALEGKVLSWIGAAPTEASAPGPETQETPKASVEPAEIQRAAEAERRQLTVMFCDLVGFTALSDRLDAEDLSDVVTSYQKTCAEGIESFDGQIAQYLGDGVLVYFGYPQAHEDDAMRALHAALRIVDEIPRLNTRLAEAHATLREMPLQVRIGIHTGPVIVGEMGGGEKRERLALGDTVNVASRLEGEAEPGSIVVSGATRHLVRGAFVFESLGERSLKGIEEPMALFRPVEATGVQSRLALAAASGLTRLVGREREVDILLERWEEAKAGDGQVGRWAISARRVPQPSRGGMLDTDRHAIGRTFPTQLYNSSQRRASRRVLNAVNQAIQLDLRRAKLWQPDSFRRSAPTRPMRLLTGPNLASRTGRGRAHIPRSHPFRREVSMLALRHSALTILLSLLLAPSASAISFILDFTPALGSASDGTITFASVGDPEPTAFSFVVNGITFDDTDIYGSWGFGWSGATPAGHNSDFLITDNDAGPAIPTVHLSGIFFAGQASYMEWAALGPALGDYAIVAVPEVGTTALSVLGLAMMAIQRKAGRL
jgi:class 3 adenylate cyclase